MSSYSKGDYAKSLGISRGELEKRAKGAGYDTTEAYYNAGGGGSSSGGSSASSGGYQNLMSDFAKEDKTFLDKYSSAIPSIYNRLSQEQGLAPLRNVAQTAVSNLEAIPGQVATNAKQMGMSSSRIGQRISGLQG